jgi:hypothetical protein
MTTRPPGRSLAVIDFGLYELQHKWSWVWAELAAGGVVRAVDKRTGLQAAWVTLQPPPGVPSVRLNVNDTIRRLGKVLNWAREGGCTEVRDQVRQRSCYVHRVTPAELVPVEHMLPGITALTRGRRLVERQVIHA